MQGHGLVSLKEESSLQQGKVKRMEFPFRTMDQVLGTDRVYLSGLEFKLLIDALASAKIGQIDGIDLFLNSARPMVERRVSEEGIEFPAAVRAEVAEYFPRVETEERQNFRPYSRIRYRLEGMPDGVKAATRLFTSLEDCVRRVPGGTEQGDEFCRLFNSGRVREALAMLVG